MEEMELPPKYHSIRELRGGYQNQVCFANDAETGNVVVIKKALPSNIRDLTMRFGLRNEAAVLARIDHPQIPTLLESDFDGGTPYIALEAMKGNSYILQWIKAFSAPKLASKLVLSALSPLDYLHENGLVHNDVKPRNLVMQWSGKVALIDFEFTGRRVDTGGTPAYMPIEQMIGENTTLQSDIYSLGVTFYEMLYGHRPYEGLPNLVRSKMFTEKINYQVPEDRTISARLVEIVEKATQKHAKDRYSSTAEIRKDIVDYLEE